MPCPDRVEVARIAVEPEAAGRAATPANIGNLIGFLDAFKADASAVEDAGAEA
jgi:hypothetical protein